MLQQIKLKLKLSMEQNLSPEQHRVHECARTNRKLRTKTKLWNRLQSQHNFASVNVLTFNISVLSLHTRYSSAVSVIMKNVKKRTSSELLKIRHDSGRSTTDRDRCFCAC